MSAAAGTSAEVSAQLVELFGDKLLHKDADGAAPRSVPTAEAVAGYKYVAIYFSAHWCGPCVRTTPLLVEAYLAQEEIKDVQVIFCSLDKTEKDFDGYYASMPWYVCAIHD
jgi:nucleoredoxin